jgi:cytochrome c-type biogenesis protein
MLSDFVDSAGQYIHTNPWLAVLAIFLGGLLSASSPCVLAMIPLMMSFVAGNKDEETGPLRAFLFSILFITGLITTFTILGIVASMTGWMYGEVSPVWNWIIAGVCLVMGLHLVGILKFTIPMPFNFQPKTRGMLGALILGLLFGIVSTPCAIPILLVLLTYLAGSGSSVSYGALLLVVYGLGHSVLILIAGTSMGLARKIIESKKLTRATEIMRQVAGGVIVLVGLYFGYLGIK